MIRKKSSTNSWKYVIAKKLAVLNKVNAGMCRGDSGLLVERKFVEFKTRFR